MKKYSLAIHSPCHEVIYHPVAASQLARVTLAFVRECEQEGLIRSQRMAHGEYGYRLAEIRQLARIRRLRETLQLDLAAVEVVLKLHQRVSDLLAQLDTVEQRLIEREQELLGEVQDLRRRLAEEKDFTVRQAMDWE